MTKDEFEANLAKIQKHNPAEPLLPELRKGYDRLRVIYMKSAIKNCFSDKQEKIEADVEIEQSDEVLRGLWKNRKELFLEMNKLSNHFHDCKSDHERASNSKAIMVIWDKITQIKSKISHYEKWADLPDEGEKFALPSDPVLLVKKLNSIRAQISQVKRKLDDLAKLDKNDPNRSEIQRYEDRLTHLKLYAGHADTAIASKGVHAT
jgi:hypothetical protein